MNKQKKLNRTVTNKEIDSVIKNLLTKKSSGRDHFTVKCYKTFKAELTTKFLKLLQKN